VKSPFQQFDENPVEIIGQQPKSHAQAQSSSLYKSCHRVPPLIRLQTSQTKGQGKNQQKFMGKWQIPIGQKAPPISFPITSSVLKTLRESKVAPHPCGEVQLRQTRWNHNGSFPICLDKRIARK
ncbi:unnamed protein product, partial [Prunus brigantina]